METSNRLCAIGMGTNKQSLSNKIIDALVLDDGIRTSRPF